ncbi:hypothetical protein NPIL_686311 [Nephila pilipes]|uniref:Uncharacterized protein n=1 Tax=Nephila pilipes TaxID=299642 RepID=A0A8X6TNC3_NEPPI|nr:hypothetical protein NPIL_686311 [Nephila pilipes]
MDINDNFFSCVASFHTNFETSLTKSAFQNAIGGGTGGNLTYKRLQSGSLCLLKYKVELSTPPYTTVLKNGDCFQLNRIETPCPSVAGSGSFKIEPSPNSENGTSNSSHPNNNLLGHNKSPVVKTPPHTHPSSSTSSSRDAAEHSPSPLLRVRDWRGRGRPLPRWVLTAPCSGKGVSPDPVGRT